MLIPHNYKLKVTIIPTCHMRWANFSRLYMLKGQVITVSAVFCAAFSKIAIETTSWKSPIELFSSCWMHPHIFFKHVWSGAFHRVGRCFWSMTFPRSVGGAHPIELHCTPTRLPLYLYQASFGAPKVHPLVNLGTPSTLPNIRGTEGVLKEVS